jgi:hypothetical protein
MATTKKPESTSVTISDKVKSYADEPFVIEKNKKAKEFMEKHGFPKELVSASHKSRAKN